VFGITTALQEQHASMRYGYATLSYGRQYNLKY